MFQKKVVKFSKRILIIVKIKRVYEYVSLNASFQVTNIFLSRQSFLIIISSINKLAKKDCMISIP